MEDFYYSTLPNEGLICGAIAYVDDVAAGFIVATDDPSSFMSRASRRHWMSLVWIILKSLGRDPRRILAMHEAYQIQSNVQAIEYGNEVGELLSFGVMPEFRSRAFVRETELAIGADLLATALSQLKALGKSRIRAIVDKDNLAAQLFYRLHGWQVGQKSVSGWRVPTMEFLFEVDDAGSTQR